MLQGSIRGLRAAAVASVVALTAGGTAAAAEVPATLKAHAQLPAMTLVPPPEQAPDSLVVSGRFAGPKPLRIERVGSVEGQSVNTAKGAPPRGTGIYLPVVGQPVQGFSGIRSLGNDEFLVLTDNGYGNKANSVDALLMFHRVRAHWPEHRVERLETKFLHDPGKKIPFKIVLENTHERHLTGGDLDIESIQKVGDLYWFGDEFGPYLVATDATGKVAHFTETVVDGKVVRSPDHHAVGTPNTPGPIKFEVRRSGGFEGMAQSTDGRFLYPLLEAPLYLGEEPTLEKVDGKGVLRLIEFDIAGRRWTGRSWLYPLEVDGNNIGDFNMISPTRGLIIERDSTEGDPRLACQNEARADCFSNPAKFKRIYVVELGEPGKLARKIAYVDLLDIADPQGVAAAGTMDGRFTFPFVTIENVDRVDERTIVVANDNNFPYSNGRKPLVADNNEFILLDVGDLMTRP